MTRSAKFFIFFFLLCISSSTLIAQNSTKKSAVNNKQLIPPQSLFQKDTGLCGEDRSIEQWDGLSFTMLKMLPVYRQFGYELYPTPQCDKQKTPINTSLQLPNFRVRYDQFEGKTITVTSIEKMGIEFFITFKEEQSNTMLYGKTFDKAIKGIAPVSILVEAQKRWSGKSVYSMKGFISTFDSLNGTIGSIKVNVETPLKVTGIRWGMPPMPPQPLWILVETPEKQKGFIPVAFTWTNIMHSKIRDFRPWHEMISESNAPKNSGWTSDVLTLVNSHNIATDLTRQQVLFSWGIPLGQETDNREPNVERWSYLAQTLTFKGDTLISINNK